MQTVAVINQKGGCGKTTTAISLSGFFAAKGWRTLLVDMDPQSHCAAGLAIPEGRIDLSIADAMLAAETNDTDLPPVEPDRLLWRVSRNLDLAPSNLKLAGLEALRGGLATQPEPEKRLTRVLASLANRYDLAVIDCSPAVGLLAYNALAAAEHVLIPVETGFFSLQGATKQVSTIKSIAKRLGVAPSHRLLPTMHDPESALARDLLEELHRRFPEKVIPLAIRYDRSLKEAASFGQPVGEYAPESAGAEDYAALADWLIANVLRQPSLRSGLRSLQPAAPIAVAVPSASIAAAVAPADDLTPLADAPVRVVTAPTDAALLPAGSPAEAPAQPPPSSRTLDMVERSRRLTDRPPAPSPAAAPAAADPLLPPSAPAARGLGVQVTEFGVLFVQPVSLGERIEVAGDFNGWSPESSPMRRNAQLGVFELLAPLPPGERQYRLVVDGRWMADPFNPTVATNPYGEINSVVRVPERPTSLPGLVAPPSPLQSPPTPPTHT